MASPNSLQLSACLANQSQVKEMESIRTLNAVYEKLREDGHKLETFRVPIVDCAL